MSDTDQVSEVENAPKRGKWPPWIWHILPIATIFFLLASLLVPALNRAKRSAIRVRCLNQLKQIGLGLKQYALENDEVFPWADIDLDQSYRCFGKLYPRYIWDGEVLTCPSSRDTRFKLYRNRSDGELLTVEQSRKSLSYAYGHNRGKPWNEAAPSSTRLAADKYTTADYSDGDLRSKPSNHEGDGRNVVRIDGSGRWDNNKGPLEADPDTEVDGSGDARNDQTGPDWWSDPPEK